MEISFLIVTRNRPAELLFSLKQLQSIFDVSCHEVLVFIDGCTATEQLRSQFSWVKWYSVAESISASPARNILYAKATGEIFIGLDDDAHLISENPIETIQHYFNTNQNLGILAFLEIKGIFELENEAIKKKTGGVEEFLCSEFVGCGFAIRKEVYKATNGFPIWVDIYGEESCVAIEVISKGFNILYTNRIAVNHRINREERIQKGKNYFRFGKQLKNTTFYYLVYYRFPFYKITKLYWHNFKKYACSDSKYFTTFFKTIFVVFISLPKVLRYRNPMDKVILNKVKKLATPKF